MKVKVQHEYMKKVMLQKREKKHIKLRNELIHSLQLFGARKFIRQNMIRLFYKYSMYNNKIDN